MIDNFIEVSKLLSFETPDDYYFVQILIRAKDDKSLGSNNRLIKTYAIKSIEGFEKYEKEIKTICDSFKARAYIHLTKRSFLKVSLLMMKELCDRISNNQCPEIQKVFNTASGVYNDAKNKTWVVDIDEKVPNRFINEMVTYIDRKCQPLDTPKFISMLETKSGYHLITKPFNVAEFKMVYPNFDVHKNNPTVLYIP